MDVTTATPAEIDTEIARLEHVAAQAAQVLDRIRKAEQARDHWVGEDPAAVDKRLTDAHEDLRPLRAAYAECRWTRVYRVDNSNGHVHTSTACSTTYGTTSFGWIPELSGSTPEEIVELAGEFACLVCFGAVRADILKAREGRPCRIETGNQRRTREEREAAAAAKAVKAAAKDAKKLVRTVRVPRTSFKIETKAAAWIELVDSVIEAQDWSDPTYNPHTSAAQRKSNHDDYAAAVGILRAVLVESLPELSAEEFEKLLAKKVTAKKRKYNSDLKAAGYPARY